ncbi:hypothetical protein [Arthrobacter sp. 7Tela_A1]|uniref:hypothetical protein n=1 Tax=Arthrobacter sp. 7Tela_A1 TaxID=3093745 RepID=UPI003BB497CC
MDEIRTPHGRIRLECDGALTPLGPGGEPAAAGAGLAADLVAAVLSGTPEGLACSPGEIRIVRTPLPAGTPSTVESAVGVDMTNLSVVVGGDKIVKLVRSWGGANRSARLLTRLAEAGVEAVPGYFGSLDWHHPARGQGTLALVSAVVPDAADGWSWAVDDVVSWFQGGEAPGWPAVLGRLIAEVHTVLLGAGAAAPPAAAQVRKRASGVLDQALSVTGGNPGLRLARRAPGLKDILEAIPETAAPAFDLHGDLHVGQILRAGGNYWLLDFDGDPQLSAAERDLPDTAARDVAHLAASFDMVASVAAKRIQASGSEALQRLYGWSRAATGEMVASYRRAVREAGATDLLDEAMLPGLIAEQLLRELIYAHRFLPRWGYAADGAITHRFTPDQTSQHKEPAWTPPALQTT